MIGTPVEKSLALAVAVVNKFSHDLIAKRKEDELDGKLDVLSWFMNLTNEETGEPFSDEYLRDIVMNFMIAGRDTTSNALTWTFHLLAHNPECLLKLREELQAHGIDTPGKHPTAVQLKTMKYTEAVVKEALRLYPSVPRDLKMCVKDDTLPDGTTIKAGQIAAYLPYSQGRLEKLWGKEAGFPHDAATFYPDRWLNEDFKPNAFYYPVFQAGLRTCMGKDMAYMEAKTATAMLVAAFDFKPIPGHPVDPEVQNSVTCPMEGGLKCVMTPR
jgi:cytochrome P450